MLKKAIIPVLLVLIMLTAATGRSPAQSGEKGLRIACVGNSITQGARLQNPAQDAYPAVLQQIFNNGQIEVKNFGIGGATMIRYGRPNLWQELDRIKQYLPEVIVIIVGTNETVGQPLQNWEHADSFEHDYADFLVQLKSLASHPVIFVCSPTDMNLKTPGLDAKRLTDLTSRRPRLWQLRKRINKIARESSVYFIDLTPWFKDKPALFTPGDGIHPNKQGYHYLAELIFKNIKSSVDHLLN